MRELVLYSVAGQTLVYKDGKYTFYRSDIEEASARSLGMLNLPKFISEKITKDQKVVEAMITYLDDSEFINLFALSILDTTDPDILRVYVAGVRDLKEILDEGLYAKGLEKCQGEQQ